MSKIRMVAICWLVFLSAFILGFYVYDAKIWPYTIIVNIKGFVVGHIADNTSLVEKIKNDFDFRPSRHITVDLKKNFPVKSDEEGLFIKLTPDKSAENNLSSTSHKELKGLKLNSRRKPPQIFISADAPYGYRLIYGTFDFKDTLHGAILIDPGGNIANVWKISQEGIEWKHRHDTNIFPHGLEIAPDGSIVTSYDSGHSLTKYGYCGNIIWRIKGHFHHSISMDDKGSIWTLSFKGDINPDTLVQIDYGTGEVLKTIRLDNVMVANPEIDIFGIIQDDNHEGSKWIGDPWHSNDVEAMPERLVKYYKGFKAGDLLVSLRSPNLIFVMDPDTLKVKWWRQGLTRRQHDPDWNNRGTITIFNNNMHRGYSNIIELDPITNEFSIIVDGANYEFYTWWRGKHQLLTNGGVLITSPDQGRVFEVDSRGKITFEFLNTYGDNDEYLALSEARFLPTGFFEELMQCN